MIELDFEVSLPESRKDFKDQPDSIETEEVAEFAT